MTITQHTCLLRRTSLFLRSIWDTSGQHALVWNSWLMWFQFTKSLISRDWKAFIAAVSAWQKLQLWWGIVFMLRVCVPQSTCTMSTQIKAAAWAYFFDYSLLLHWLVYAKFVSLGLLSGHVLHFTYCCMAHLNWWPANKPHKTDLGSTEAPSHVWQCLSCHCVLIGPVILSVYLSVGVLLGCA